MTLLDIPWIGGAARLLEMAGVLAILVGVLIAAILFARDLWRREAGRDAYDRFRANLGRGILLGLELLVGADIIATITAPLSFESVGLLAVIVLIRTFGRGGGPRPSAATPPASGRPSGWRSGSRRFPE